MVIPRRQFLLGAAAVLAGAWVRAANGEKLRAAVIGHTGKGDYGHGLDLIFQGHDDIELVGLADADEAGRAKAVARCKPARAYADWREMLEKEKPNLVSVAPRQTGERLEMLTAAFAGGAHVICEKPFVRSPADADRVLALARQKNLKIAVSHQIRLSPAVTHLKKKMDAGLIGDLQQISAWGKQDRRAGGEDLAVLGIHLFDLMRMFAGNAAWCSARVLCDGREATLADARPASEDLGPVLGTDIDAQFSFEHGVLGTFTSRPGLQAYAGYWGMEFVGSQGAARILADIWPRVLIKHAGKWDQAGRTDEWRPIEDDPTLHATPAERSNAAANRRLADDWIAAITTDREPTCSGANGAHAVEMAHAVWRAGLSGRRMTLPLAERGHALAR